MPHIRSLRALPLIAAFAAQPALAQINEADRLARCQNNREAYARAESERQFHTTYVTWSAEGIARARTALVAIRRDEAAMRNAFDNDDRRVVLRRMCQAALAAGVFCPNLTPQIGDGLAASVAREIDLAVAGQQPSQLAERRMEQFRTNLIALRCMEPGETQIGAGPVSPPLTGADANVVSIRGRYYNSSNGRHYQVAQQGTSFTLQSEDGTESGSGTITVGPTRQWLTATVNGRGGTRTLRGHVTMSGTDPSQVWLLDWVGGESSWQRQQ